MIRNESGSTQYSGTSLNIGVFARVEANRKRRLGSEGMGRSDACEFARTVLRMIVNRIRFRRERFWWVCSIWPPRKITAAL
jgi:hypothetical protein